jgi:hypothetical protein
VVKVINGDPEHQDAILDVDGSVVVPAVDIPSFDQAMQDPNVKAAVDAVLGLAYALVKTYSPEFKDAEDV